MNSNQFAHRLASRILASTMAIVFATAGEGFAADCFSSVCTGTELSMLSVKWESRKAHAAQYAREGKQFGIERQDRIAIAREAFPALVSADIAAVADFVNLYGEWFLDSSVAPAFGRASRFCSFDSLLGAFRSESGHLTRVVFRPKVRADGSAAFAVALIDRQYKGVISDSPKGKAILEATRERFGSVCSKWDAMDPYSPPCAGATYDDDPGGMVVSIFDSSLHTLSGTMDFKKKQSARLRQQEECRPAVSLD